MTTALLHLAARLRSLRRRAGLTQVTLAVRAGVSSSVVAVIEQGKQADPRLSTLGKLAAGLGVSVTDLLVRQDDDG